MIQQLWYASVTVFCLLVVALFGSVTYCGFALLFVCLSVGYVYDCCCFVLSSLYVILCCNSVA